MPDDPLVEMVRRMLADLFASSLSRALPSQEELKARRSTIPKPALAPTGEDMDSRLRSIRRYMSPIEFAGLKHINVETVYRRIKAGMPADRDLNGRNLMIYPPQVAEWEQNCREARNKLMRSKLVSDKNGANHHYPTADRKGENKR